MDKGKIFVIVLLLSLILLVPLALIVSPFKLTSVDIGDGVWHLQPKIETLIVNDVADEGTNLYKRAFDPDGTVMGEYTAPLIVAEITNLRTSDTPSKDMGDGWTAYELLFDIGMKTQSQQWTGTLGYDVFAEVQVDFRVDVQKGIFADVPDAMVTDITIRDYVASLTAAPTANPEWVQTYMVDGWGQGSVAPIMEHRQDAGVPLLSGGTTTSAQASVGCGLRPGANAHWACGPVINWPCVINHFDSYNVFVKYTIVVQVWSKEPFVLDPWGKFLEMFQEWTYAVKTHTEAFFELLWIVLTTWAPIILIAVFVLIVIALYLKYRKK